MTEREIRRIITEVCGELDRRARGLVFPSLLGAGLALGGCGDRTTPADSMVPRPDAAYGIQADGWVSSDALYMAPFDAGVEQRLKKDLPPVPPYMAPDVVAPPQPEYIAPAPDGGVSTLYSAPAPDLK